MAKNNDFQKKKHLFLGVVVRSVANLLVRSLPMSGRIEKKNRSIVVVVETKQKRFKNGLQSKNKTFVGPTIARNKKTAMTPLFVLLAIA